jgi:UDP-N-acetylglucosamine 3-dehydrogenase
VSRPLPVAVVGAGAMGTHHARNYAELPAADLRAIVDVDVERAERLAARFRCRAYACVEEFLAEEPSVAAVSVAVPTALHVGVASTLLAAARHVLVEKPIAATVEEAEELVGLARANGVVLAVGHVERFNPAVRTLRERVRRRELGDVLSLLARRVGLMPPRVHDANVLLDLAIHDVDVFRFLLDAGDPDEVYCNAGKALNGDLFDFADVFLRFGPVGCLLQVNWLTPVKVRSLAVTGTRGYAELEYVRQELELFPAQRVRETESFAQVARYSEVRPERVAIDSVEPLRRELEGFVARARGRAGEIVTGEEGTASLAVVETIVAAADAARR